MSSCCLLRTRCPWHDFVCILFHLWFIHAYAFVCMCPIGPIPCEPQRTGPYRCLVDECAIYRAGVWGGALQRWAHTSWKGNWPPTHHSSRDFGSRKHSGREMNHHHALISLRQEDSLSVSNPAFSWVFLHADLRLKCVGFLC